MKQTTLLIMFEYNDADGNFHYNDVGAKTKNTFNYRCLEDEIDSDIASEFYHKMLKKYCALNNQRKNSKYPSFKVIRQEWEIFKALI